MVTSAAGHLTVKLPPPPWFEGWESTTVGRYAPSSNAEVSVAGDKGHWVVVDTVSFFPECFPIGNHAEIVTGNGRKSLRLFSVPNNGGCAENISVDIDGRTSPSFPIPLLPSSEVSFFAQGLMVNPQWNGLFGCINKPCGDTTHLQITDDHDNQVLYILQRALNYVEHALTNGPSNLGYREIFMDPAGGSFTRNLYTDLASIAGSAGVGTAVVGVEFALASEGWAELDDLRIGSAGFLFSNWTDGVLSYTNPLKFVMASNLVLEANFVSNPFLPVAGLFNGLFRNPSTVEHSSSGAFKAAVQGSGAFSATLQTGARRLAFAGRFGLDGKSTNVVARRGTNALTIELCLKFDGSEEMSGRVTDGLWSSELLVDRAVFSALANPATNFARQYTLLIPGGTNGSVTEPAGDGFAAVTISRGGLATIKSTLADGTRAVLVVPVSKRGDMPLYLSLYGGAGRPSDGCGCVQRPRLI